MVIGMDIAKRSIQICVQDESGTVMQEKRLRARPEDLERMAEEWGPQRVLLESSTGSEWIARKLESLKCTVIVANPNFGPMYATADKKVKTDKRDARALADALRMGAYRGAYRVTDAEQQLRQVLAAREQLVGQRTSLVVLVRSQFEWYGLPTPRCATCDFWRRVHEQGIPTQLRPSVAPLLDALAGLEDHIGRLTGEIERRAKESKAAQLLETVPGVGSVIALGFVAALCNTQRFSDARQPGSFLGLVPTESSSGEKRAQGSITKAGDTRARMLLVQGAWALVRSKETSALPLQEWFATVASRRGKGVAIVGLARKLATILFVMWRDGVPFDPEKTRSRKKEAYVRQRKYVLKDAMA